MRHHIIAIVYFFSCLNVRAAQEPITIHAAMRNVSSTAIETYLTPYDDVEDRFLQFLDQAQNKCYVASYSITNPDIIKKLVDLHRKGVDVEILTDKTQAAGKKESIALAILRENGIPVFAGRSVENALMHCKFCVIDDHLVEDGSWNFTVSANREDNILNFVDSRLRARIFLDYWLKIQRDMK
jgi:phosphatidylserine/phosphatidylglycerophosphate/cardiolipin synthase-like enzyme